MIIKRLLLTLSFSLITLNSYALTIQESSNLLSKIGFSPSIKEAEELKNLSFEQSINKIINESNSDVENNYIDLDSSEIKLKLKNLSKEEKKEYQKKLRDETISLKSWWFKEMLKTDSPLTERMTMFWHNHFTSSIKKIKSPYLMLNQNKLFRKYALGNFGDLLKEILKDPAMLIYLDTQNNKKTSPNENFARELLELFTLGEGHYTEKDIKESAKAFTGLRFNREKDEVIFQKKQFNNNQKVFLGEKGNFKPEDIINIILKQEQTSVYITQKLWKEFVSYDVNDIEIKRIAKVFKNSNYEIKSLLKELFLSKEFKDSIGTQIKSPVELMVGTIRQFEVNVTQKELNQLVKYSSSLGQDIFNPPNVKGWSGGNDWISSDTLILRRQFLQKILRGNDISYLKKTKKKMTVSYMLNTWDEDSFKKYSKEDIKNFLLPITNVNQINKEESLISYIKDLVLDPVYQLK